MAKPVSHASEDFLGFLAFGSGLVNVLQAISKSTLETKHRDLQNYAKELRLRYDNLGKRYQIAAQEYAILRQENERLWNEAQRLHAVLNQATRQNNQLIRERDDFRDAITKLQKGEHGGAA